MSSEKQNLSQYASGQIPAAADKKVGIVVADWNSDITHALLKACKETLMGHEVKEDDISVLHVPGSFELPFGAKLLTTKYKLDAVICLGCVIRGDTQHNVYISDAVAKSLMQLGLFLNIPSIFGVLTPENQQQAEDRAGGKHGNKGVEAAVTALKMMAMADGLQKRDRKIGF